MARVGETDHVGDRSLLIDGDRDELGDGDGFGVVVVGGLGLGAVAVDVGGVGDRSVVDVALGEGMAGGALAGFAGIEGRYAGGQETVTEGSVTVTPVRVTLPVFSTSKV